MLKELNQEAATTKRVLERVPENKLSWTPHPKSMSLGQLALHTAQVPGALCGLAQLDEFDASGANFLPPMPNSREEILVAFEESVRKAADYLGGLTPELADAPWRLTLGGNEVFSMPRAEMLRALVLNHWYHHRGQLSVYLRLLDVPVPVIYGRSADESPFG